MGPTKSLTALVPGTLNGVLSSDYNPDSARSEMRVFCIRPCDPGKAFGELWPGYWLMGGFL